MIQMSKLIHTKQLLMTVLAIIMLISCQEGYDDTKEPDKSITISANDNIADLIGKMVLKDGSFDNIIDKCSEISIKYPYSVRINDDIVEVRSLEDVERIKLDYFNYREDIKINYPVTASYSDYSESVLSNIGELKKIQKRNNGNLIDDDIECIDFIYPIEINLYNKKYQKSNLIVARNDYEMYKVFGDIDDLIVELNFPIDVESLDKKRVTINNNIKLEKEIKDVVDSYDEESEDDEDELSEEDYPHEELLTLKDWKVLQYVDTKNEASLFHSYVFHFDKDNTVQVNTPTGNISGVWEMDIQGKLKVLRLEFDTEETPLVWLNDDWEIKNNSPMVINMEAESSIHGKKRKMILEVVDK